MRVTIKELLEAGVHFGHRANRWNPKIKPYIFGIRNGIHIFDLQKTQKLLEQACSFVAKVVSEGDQVLFVGTKPQAQAVVEDEATRCHMPFVTSRWLGGTLTNFTTLQRSLARIDEIDKLLAEGSVERLPKKEVIRLEKEQARLLKNLKGLRKMKELPGCLFVVDTTKEHIATKEAERLGIPVVGLVDTNGDPDSVTYVVPGNDDAIRSIRLVASAIADACLEGIQARRQAAEWEGVPAGQPAPEVVVVGQKVIDDE